MGVGRSFMMSCKGDTNITYTRPQNQKLIKKIYKNIKEKSYGLFGIASGCRTYYSDPVSHKPLYHPVLHENNVTYGLNEYYVGIT